MMIARPSALLALTLAALHLSSCAGTHAPVTAPAPPDTPPVVLHPGKGSHWTAQAGAFHIELIPGKRAERKWIKTGDDTVRYLPASTYRVTWEGAGGRQRIETESQYLPSSLQALAKEHVFPAQVILADDGNALVIDEAIPNDCIATSNFTYLARDEKGRLTSTYFELPRAGDEPVESSLLPRVTGIHGQVISYRYPGGSKATGSVTTSGLKKIPHPVPPG